MLLKIYEIYRSIALDSIISFLFLLGALYYLCGMKSKTKHVFWTIFYFVVPFVIYTLLYATFLVKYTAYIYWYFFLLLITIAIPFASLLLDKSVITKTIYIFFFVAMVQLFKLCCVPLYVNEHTITRSVYARIDILLTILMFVFITLFTRFLKHLNLSPNIKTTVFKPIIFLYFPISILIGFVVSVAFVPQEYQICILAIVILTNVPLILYVFSMLISSYEEQRNLDVALTLSKAEINSYKTSVIQHEQIKKERHELKNKYFYLETLLKQNKYSEAESFIKQTIGDFDLNNSYVDTGNKFLDYLLNKKIMESNSNGINTVTQVCLQQNLKFDELSLCTILSNLIDNAIEYSKQNQDCKELHIDLTTNQSYLICIIQNKIYKDVVLDTENLNTTKSDKLNHGIGLKVVKATVKKCNGIYSFNADNGYFTARVMIPLG